MAKQQKPRGSSRDKTGTVAKAGKRITRHVAAVYEPEACDRCGGTGLMPLWQREQSKPALPKGTNCSECSGKGSRA
jgi:DnaJ-class molecular chaperone